jgi:hypothetical protein
MHRTMSLLAIPSRNNKPLNSHATELFLLPLASVQLKAKPATDSGRTCPTLPNSTAARSRRTELEAQEVRTRQLLRNCECPCDIDRCEHGWQLKRKRELNYYSLEALKKSCNPFSGAVVGSFTCLR